MRAPPRAWCAAVREGGLAVFRGIPFAAPPTGRLRFAAPQPAAAWDGEREASAFGSPPPQSATYGPAPAPFDDNWLTLNVWTPAPDPAARRPVMVWIYGGAYKVGSADAPGYDGARLAREGGLVVVTFNYRTGVEGFAQIQGAPANRGLPRARRAACLREPGRGLRRPADRPGSGPGRRGDVGPVPRGLDAVRRDR